MGSLSHGRRAARFVRERAVVLVGAAYLGVAVAYVATAPAAPSTLALELFFPVATGLALLRYGSRRCRFDPRPSPGRTGSRARYRSDVVAACCLAFAALTVMATYWGVYLHSLRIDYHGLVVQQTLTAMSFGGAGGGVIGHVYVELTHHSRANDRLSRAVDASMDGIAVLDEDRHRYANDAYASLYGFADSDAVVDREWTSLYTAAAADRIEREVLPALSERSAWRGTLTGQRLDGTTFPQEVTITALDGEYVAIVRDVSTRRDREQRIQVLNRVLRHNLRNAFTVIRGHVNLVAEAEPALERAHVEPIRQEIDDLLATADKARGVERVLERRSDRDLIDAPRAVRRVVDQATTAHPEARIVSRVEESGTGLVAGSAVDALNELVDNAVEHNDGAEPTVEVHVRSVAYETGSRIEFTVADDGPGVPEAERRAVAEGRETQLDHGSGLGLWLVAWLVRGAGGDVRFADADGGGTAITLSFPHEREPGRDRAPDCEAGDDAGEPAPVADPEPIESSS